MRRITLILREEIDPFLPIEAESISPEILSKRIDVPVYVGNEQKLLKDVFYIRVDGEAAGPSATEIILVGDCHQVKRIGEYMTTGRSLSKGTSGCTAGIL